MARKLYLSTKFPHQEIRWNFCILISVKRVVSTSLKVSTMTKQELTISSSRILWFAFPYFANCCFSVKANDDSRFDFIEPVKKLRVSSKNNRKICNIRNIRNICLDKTQRHHFTSFVPALNRSPQILSTSGMFLLPVNHYLNSMYIFKR